MVRVVRNVSQQRKVAHDLERRARPVSVKSRTLLVNKYVVVRLVRTANTSIRGIDLMPLPKQSYIVDAQLHDA